MESNKKIVREYVQKFNMGDLEGMSGLFTPDALIYGVLGWGKLEDVMPIWAQLVDSLGMQLNIEDLIAEDDIVAIRYTERGISKAPFFDKPATGKTYELVAMEWFQFKGGKIHRRWGARDAATQSRQLGWEASTAKEDQIKYKRKSGI